MQVPEGRHRLWDQSRSGGGEGGDAQAPSAHAEYRRQVVLGRLHLGEDHIGVLEQHRSGGGRPYSAAVADEQWRARLGLPNGLIERVQS